MAQYKELFKQERFRQKEAETCHRFSPRLAALIYDWLIEREPPLSSILDLGCGDGAYLADLSKRLRAPVGIGVEGSERFNAGYPHIRFNTDVTQPLTIKGKFNVICIEVGEHIYAVRTSGLLDNIEKYCDHKLVLTWAIPGQAGLRHVNCLPPEKVIIMVENRGFKYLKSQSEAWREEAGKDLWWFKNSIYLFERTA